MARILIVDPNPRVRSLIASHLAAQGHELLLADHGVAAALLLRQHQADLILVDQQVPMGGIKTARLLRLHPACQRVPILLLVDGRLARSELLAEGRRAQIRLFVAKPCTAAALQAKIQEGLRQRLERLPITAMREEIGQLSGLPVLLSNHRKMLSLLSREDGQVEVPELIRTIELDQGLTTEVLRVCHSAYYGFRGNTLEAAVTFLGIDKIRRIVQ
ncbi:MAG: response regulator, partial [Candidatus Latescibacterota bacterium]